MGPQKSIHKEREDYRLGVALTLTALGMLGLSFAAVPLYRLICQKTGFGGTPQKVLFQEKSDDVLSQNHVIRVQFTASVHRDLPWHFEPKQHQVFVKIAEPTLVYYKARNFSNRPIVGMATYNISPDKAAIFFGKIQCFCFEEQKLAPFEEMEMPVLFTISKDILKNPFTKNLKTITLSYTFFEQRSK